MAAPAPASPAKGLTAKDTVPYVPSPDMPGDKYYEKTVTDNSPLGMKFSRVEITTVVPDSWAAKNGIEVDDEIVEVGGKVFRPLTPQERIAAFKQARPLVIKFKRPEIKDTYYTLMLDEVKVGMGFTGARVTSISAGGWAERAGVQLHDEIIELAGASFHDLTDREKIEKLKEPRPILLKFKRPGRVMRAEFASGTTVKKVPGMNDVEAAKKAAEIKSMKEAQAKNGTLQPAIGSKADKAAPAMAKKVVKQQESMGFFARCCAPRDQIGEDDVVVVGTNQ